MIGPSGGTGKAGSCGIGVEEDWASHGFGGGVTAVADTTGTQTENGAKDARDTRHASTDLTPARCAPAIIKSRAERLLRLASASRRAGG